MLEPMKKPHTKKNAELIIIGPAANKTKALKMLKSIGFVAASDSVPWRETFQDIGSEKLPGTALIGARIKEGLTQQKLSELTNIPQSHISAMEHGKRSIGKKRAKILSDTLKVGYKVFL